MNDVTGKWISIGDRVVYSEISDSSSLKIGTAQSFTPKKIRILPAVPDWRGDSSLVLKFPDQVAVIDRF